MFDSGPNAALTFTPETSQSFTFLQHRSARMVPHWSPQENDELGVTNLKGFSLTYFSFDPQQELNQPFHTQNSIMDLATKKDI